MKKKKKERSVRATFPRKGGPGGAARTGYTVKVATLKWLMN